MAATRQIVFCMAGLMVLGTCLALSAEEMVVPFRPPVVLEEEEDRPPVGSWNYSDPDTKIFCILSIFAMRMTFDHPDFTDNPVIIDLPVDDTTSTDDSMCDKGDPLDPEPETLSIKFNEDDFNLQIKFGYDLDLDVGDREWYIDEITLDYRLDDNNFPGYNGPNTTDKVTFRIVDDDGGAIVKARVHQAYRCDSKIEEGPEMSQEGVSVTIATWDFDLEAYRTRTDLKMSFPERCLVDQERDKLVPGIIGGCLLVTVITVLIIYVLMRKQRDRGYQANEDEDAAKAAEAES